MKRQNNRREPKQQRALETRAALLEAGVIAFSAKSHDLVSLAKDVLEPAGVSAGSFYHQFRDKTDLLVAVLDEHDWIVRQTVAFAIGEGQEGSGEDPVRKGFVQFFDDLDANEDAWRVLFNCRDSSEPRVRSAVKRTTESWVDQTYGQLVSLIDGSAEDTEDLAAVLWALGGGLSTYYLAIPNASRRHRRAGLIDAAVTMTTQGILAPARTKSD